LACGPLLFPELFWWTPARRAVTFFVSPKKVTKERRPREAGLRFAPASLALQVVSGPRLWVFDRQFCDLVQTARCSEDGVMS